MSRKSVHTVPKSDGGWANKAGGKTVSNHNSKATAQEKGREVAKKTGAEHVIHNKDGRIGQSNSYGRDPNPPKDKK
jgi:hypothetical protein